MTAWWKRKGPNCQLPSKSCEPVSDDGARNGIFRCRGNEAKQANSPQFQQPVVERAGLRPKSKAGAIQQRGALRPCISFL
jgi:hypothetical protein